MKKLIIALLCVFVHFADAQKGQKLPQSPKVQPLKLNSPAKTKPKTVTNNLTTNKDTTINDSQFVWYKGGYVARNQKIVFLNLDFLKKTSPKITQDSLLNFVKQKFAIKLGIGANNYAQILTKKKCDCSNNLVLLEYPGLESVEILPDPDGSSSGGNSLGKEDEFVLNRVDNLDRQTFLSRKNTSLKQEKVVSKTVKIAYIDTGITLNDLAIIGEGKKIFYTGQDFGDLSNPNKLYGKNFTDNTINENIDDDSPNKHGTNISHILMNALSSYKVKIMPLKVFKDGQGVLFDALCAMMYAKNEKFNIINCSWGHGGMQNDVFNRVIDILEKNKIMVVCSAGNECKELGKNNYSHFPAMFSKVHKNVITVSIAKNRGSSQNPCCNFSSMYVNLNYQGNQNIEVPVPQTYDTVIGVPLQTSTVDYMYGSSYAAAWATGIFAKKYFEYTINGMERSRSNFIGDDRIIRFSNGKRVLRSSSL